MEVRQKMIAGQVHYEIAEVFHHHGGEVEYRSIVPLGTDSDPNEALRKHRASLVEVTRAMMRLEPLRDTDPAIHRKYETLRVRRQTEQDRIGLLMEVIERIDGVAPADGDDSA
jgi:hypothetical protein